MTDDTPVTGSRQKVSMLVDGESWGRLRSFEMRPHDLTLEMGGCEYDVSLYVNQGLVDHIERLAMGKHHFVIKVSDTTMAFDGFFTNVRFEMAVESAVSLEGTIVSSGSIATVNNLIAVEPSEILNDDIDKAIDFDGVFWLTLAVGSAMLAGLGKMLGWY